MRSVLTLLARRFVAGETLKEALDVVERFNRQGFLTTLDYLGEDVTRKHEAQAATDQYVAILKALKKRRLDVNISIKLTQLGLAIDRDLCEKNLYRIVRAAYETQGFVRTDIEGSAYTGATFETIMKVKTNASPLGAAVQAMLKRTPEDVTHLLERDISIRLCKGAYKEPPEIAHQKHNRVCRAYLDLAKRLLMSDIYHGIATHDTDIIDALKAFSKNNGIDRNSFEFQMLMGIRPALQRKLLAEGWRIRIYIPFGRHWLPYMFRRLRERKENVWFVVKNFFRR